MSGPFVYRRAKREAEAAVEEAPIADLDGEMFTLAPKLKARVLEGIGRADHGDIAGVFDALAALVPGEEKDDEGNVVKRDYDRFMALDYDQDQLMEIVLGLIKLYEPDNTESGKSSGSPPSSNGTGASSTPTSSASTALTSEPAGSENGSALVASSP